MFLHMYEDMQAGCQKKVTHVNPIVQAFVQAPYHSGSVGLTCWLRPDGSFSEFQSSG